MFRTQEKLKCMKCNIIPQQFIVLNCYHLLCHDCLLQRNPFNMQITIVCSCGCQTLLKDNNTQRLRSPKTRESLQNCQFEKKKVIRNIQSIDEETIDETYNTAKASSIRRKDSANKLIKQIGCFTKSPLLKTNIKDIVQSPQSIDDQSHINSVLTKQLKYIEIQFNKSISDLKDVFESKIQQFTKIMKHCKRNIRQLYSQIIYDKDQKIKLLQFSKAAYEPISKQLDKLQKYLFNYKINISKQVAPLKQVPSQHRRLKTQVYQIQTQIIVHPKKLFHHRSPSFQRYNSTEFICPHVSLTLQKNKFIKKKTNNIDSFM